MYKKIAILLIIFVLSACNFPGGNSPSDLQQYPSPVLPPIENLPPNFFIPTQDPSQPNLPPTPDNPHAIPSLRSDQEIYTVQSGDTIGVIAARFGVTAEAIILTNSLTNPDVLSIGQSLVIPPPDQGAPGSGFKLIPDSELVNGPLNAYFDLNGYVASQNGQLAIYREEAEGEILSGAEIVTLVAGNYSVNPRLLLAVLEYQSQWLTEEQSHLDALSFPIGLANPARSGLYKQLSWAADQLNLGFYLWRADALGALQTSDGYVIIPNNTINAGTAGVQYFFSLLYDEAEWHQIVSEQGFILTYKQMFGDPFAWAIEPLVPLDLSQPTLQLPFETGVTWNFTGGAHGGWGDGSAWAALDFAPIMDILGCNSNEAWVTASAEGLIIRSRNGQVVQDLDGDGNEGSGWVIVYMHVESRDRIAAGTYIQAGHRIGHPSCEGGVSTGTHLHIARRYNGEWISAGGNTPFTMDGWVSISNGYYYDGYMVRENQTVESCECQDAVNAIQR